MLGSQDLLLQTFLVVRLLWLEEIYNHIEASHCQIARHIWIGKLTLSDQTFLLTFILWLGRREQRMYKRRAVNFKGL